VVVVTEEVLPGIWRFESPHPDWTEDEDWGQSVAWWAFASEQGVMLVDPLVTDWEALDAVLMPARGCAGIVRTVHWHQRSIPEASARYNARVWAKPPPDGTPALPFDHPVPGGRALPGGTRAFSVERADELALFIPSRAALMFGDAMLRREDGELQMCPESWLQPEGGRERLREVLGGLMALPLEHVLVSHGPFVRSGGPEAMEAALG
jgi:hypothetical protein